MDNDRHSTASAMTALAMLACLSVPCLAAPVTKARRIETSSSPATVVVGEVCEQPERSEASSRNGESGTTELLILVNPDGTVADMKVATSSGFDDLDASTIAAFRKCRFIPLQKKSSPVAAWLPLTHVWENAPSDPEPDKEAPCAKPVYPRMSLRYDEEGKVTLRFRIGEDGAIMESQIVRSSGFPLLDNAALDALQKCRYKPGMQKGKPIQATYTMQYVWVLH
jgi:TonB family protein